MRITLTDIPKTSYPHPNYLLTRFIASYGGYILSVSPRY